MPWLEIEYSVLVRAKSKNIKRNIPISMVNVSANINRLLEKIPRGTHTFTQQLSVR